MFFLPCFGFWSWEGGFTWPLSSADPGPGTDSTPDYVVLIQPVAQWFAQGLEWEDWIELNLFYTSDTEKENDDRIF